LVFTLLRQIKIVLESVIRKYRLKKYKKNVYFLSSHPGDESCSGEKNRGQRHLYGVILL
jgi:hypothetical protein